MFSALIEYLQERGLYKITTIEDLKNCQCGDIDKPVIDLFAVKDAHFQSIHQQSPKSVSGLFIEKDQIYLIHTIPYHPSSTTKDIQQLLNEYFSEGIINKIKKSIEALDDIVSYYGLANSFSEYYLSVNSGKKIRTLILAELTPRQYTALKLGALEQFNIGTMETILGEVLLITCDEFKLMFP